MHASLRGSVADSTQVTRALRLYFSWSEACCEEGDVDERQTWQERQQREGSIYVSNGMWAGVQGICGWHSADATWLHNVVDVVCHVRTFAITLVLWLYT